MDPAELPLRDIHLPPPVSWWPPAPGWWGVLAVAAIALASYAGLRYLERRRRSLPVVARAEMNALRSRYGEHHDVRRLATELSVLLRRICISRFPRTRVASLTGNAWLDFLDSQLGGDRFRNGAGRTLASVPYGPPAAPEKIDAEALLALCEDWLRAVSSGSRRDDRSHV